MYWKRKRKERQKKENRKEKMVGELLRDERKRKKGNGKGKRLLG